MSDKAGDGKDEKQFKVIDKRKVGEGEDAGAETGSQQESPVGNEQNSASGNHDHGHNDDIKAKFDEGPEGKASFEADFSTFIYSLNTQALLFLGKIPNPITKKYEKDIDTAKYLIDTIDMLSKKTKGNLDENESKMVENVLYDLRMAYISEKK